MQEPSHWACKPAYLVRCLTQARIDWKPGRVMAGRASGIKRVGTGLPTLLIFAEASQI